MIGLVDFFFCPSRQVIEAVASRQVNDDGYMVWFLLNLVDHFSILFNVHTLLERPSYIFKGFSSYALALNKVPTL